MQKRSKKNTSKNKPYTNKIKKIKDIDKERLQKVIASTGYCSRRKAEELITEGKVTVNGKRVTELGTKVDPLDDQIKVGSKLLSIPYKKNFLYYVLNKPSGYITAKSDPNGRPIVMHFFPKQLKRLLPVGRLDYNTEGILLFTDDGELLHRLTHPSYEIRRKYLVRAKGLIPHEKLLKLQTSGLFIDGVKIKNINIQDIRSSGSATWFQIEIGEGRNREVRKIVLALDSEVLRLKRIAYGAVHKGIPPKGSIRELTKDEVNQLYESVGLKRP
jgi:23S rRNA pseudouridine2605 synthase